MTTPTPPVPGPIAGATQAPETDLTNKSVVITEGADLKKEDGSLEQNTGEGSSNQQDGKETDPNQQDSGTGVVEGQELKDAPVIENQTQQDPVVDPSKIDPPTDIDTTAGITDTIGDLKATHEKGFHYAGVTDSLDKYIEIMNGRRVVYQAGSAQQKTLLSIFRTLLKVGDQTFPQVLQAVLLRINENLDDEKCFSELKRGAHLIDPTSTSKKPAATFTNRDDYQFFNNMMALLCNIADPKGRREVLSRINVTAVFAPVQKDKSLTHGINRFVEFLHEQR